MALQNNYTLAEVLRAARLEKKMTLEQVELSTKIRSSYISALEKGDYAKLPADIYIRGMLRLYSHFLGLEYQEILRLYRRDGHIGNAEVEEKKYYLIFKNFISSFVLTSRFIWIVFFALISILISIYIYSSYQSLKTPPKLILFTPENNQEYLSSNMKVQGMSELNTEIRINGQKFPVDEKGNFVAEVTLNEGKNTILVQAISSRNHQINEIKREVILKASKKEILEIKIDAVKDTKLSVFLDDKEVFSGQIKANETKSFEVTGRIKIQADDGQAIFYSINQGEKIPLNTKVEFTEKEIFNAKGS